MMKYYLSYLFISCFVFFSLGGKGIPIMTINSEEAEYNGHEISLTGDVTVHHPLGKLFAKHFLIVPKGENKKLISSKLIIRDGVNIEFPNGASLTCEEAEVDYENLYGTFLGSLEKPEVIFTNQKNLKSLKLGSELTIQGARLQIWFVENDLEGNLKQKVEFKQLQADGRVRIDYDHDFNLSADRALYQTNHKESSSPLSGGRLLLTPMDGSFCQLTTVQGDSIWAESITVNTKTHEVYLRNTKGTLTSHKQAASQKLDFSADELIWNNLNQSFVLSGHVEVVENKELKLQTTRDLFIHYRSVNEKREIKSILIPRETVLAYMDTSNEVLRKVTCHGSFLIDHENLTIRMDSPKDDQGIVVKDKQVFFDDVMGEMSANQVQITYLMENNKLFVPSVIHLAGHVQVFNRFDGHVQEASSVLQYALADEIEFLPTSHDMTLMGENGNRVLFFDRINSVQMSAPGLKIHYDKINRKETIQGLGDVRFTFIEREFNQLKDRFHLTGKSL